MPGGRKRRRPLREGSLREIFTIFIHPLIKLKPQNWHINDWLDSMFCVKDREIKRYVAQETFNLPPSVKIADTLINPAAHLTKVRKGAVMLIRTDKTIPQKVDLEIMNGVGNKSQLFELTKRHLTSILPLLKEKPFRHSKRKIHSWENDFAY